MTLKGKSGQVRENGKKTGGVMFNLAIPGVEVEKIVQRIFQDPGKLAQAMFAYGMTSEVQKELGYEIPGSQPWEEGKEVGVYSWSEEDTKDFIEALDTWDAMPRSGGGLSVEARQEAWDKKAKMLEGTGIKPEDILGKRPVAKG